MPCTYCKKLTDDGSSQTEGHATCICSSTIHYRCLYPSRELALPWGNNNSPSKMVISIMSSPAFCYKCKICRNLTTSSTNKTLQTTPTNTTDTSKTKSTITTITNNSKSSLNNPNYERKLDTILKILETHTTQITNIEKLNNTTTKSFAQVLTLNNKTLTTPGNKPTETKHSATIENINKDNLNLNYIKSLLNKTNINPTSISNVIFKNKHCNITFTTSYAKDAFIALNGTLSNTDYSKLFIHDILSAEQQKLKYIYYHAIKSGLIKNYKCSLNLKNNKYELRPKLANNKTNWKLKPLTVTDNLLTEWTDSFANYIKKLEIAKSTKN